MLPTIIARTNKELIYGATQFLANAIRIRIEDAKSEEIDWTPEGSSVRDRWK